MGWQDSSVVGHLLAYTRPQVKFQYQETEETKQNQKYNWLNHTDDLMKQSSLFQKIPAKR